MFCKYKEPVQPERNTRFRVNDLGTDRHLLSSRYKIVRDELVWREKEHAASDDKDAADKIAALLNGDGR